MNMLSESDLTQNLYEPLETKKWGFNSYSEKINGRAAMIGFFIMFLIEFITKQNLIDYIK